MLLLITYFFNIAPVHAQNDEAYLNGVDYFYKLFYTQYVDDEAIDMRRTFLVQYVRGFVMGRFVGQESAIIETLKEIYPQNENFVDTTEGRKIAMNVLSKLPIDCMMNLKREEIDERFEILYQRKTFEINQSLNSAIPIVIMSLCPESFPKKAANDGEKK